MKIFPEKYAVFGLLVIASLLTGGDLLAAEKPHTKSLAGTYQKPGANISIAGQHTFFLSEYSDQQITVSIQVPRIKGELLLTVNTKEEIKVADYSGMSVYVLDGQADQVSVPLTVSTGRSGLYYLMLNAQINDITGASQGRAMGVAIEVGNVAALNQQSERAQPRIQKLSGSRKVKALPAQETIR